MPYAKYHKKEKEKEKYLRRKENGYYKNNRKSILKSVKNYYEKNRNIILKKAKEYRIKTKDKNSKEWKKRNIDKVRQRERNKYNNEEIRFKRKIRSNTIHKFGRLKEGYIYHHYTEPYEIDKFLNKVSLCLAPVLYGAGMNGKIAQALAFGIPVITTEFGAKQNQLTSNKNALVAKNAEEFILLIDEYLKDDLLREFLSLNGQKFMENYTITCWKDKFLEAVKKWI